MSSVKMQSCSFGSIAVTNKHCDSAVFPPLFIYFHSTEGPSVTSQLCGFQL